MTKKITVIFGECFECTFKYIGRETFKDKLMCNLPVVKILIA